MTLLNLTFKHNNQQGKQLIKEKKKKIQQYAASLIIRTQIIQAALSVKRIPNRMGAENKVNILLIQWLQRRMRRKS